MGSVKKTRLGVERGPLCVYVFVCEFVVFVAFAVLTGRKT